MDREVAYSLRERVGSSHRNVTTNHCVSGKTSLTPSYAKSYVILNKISSLMVASRTRCKSSTHQPQLRNAAATAKSTIKKSNDLPSSSLRTYCLRTVHKRQFSQKGSNGNSNKNETKSWIGTSTNKTNTTRKNLSFISLVAPYKFNNIIR